jgi:hypothetical protein
LKPSDANSPGAPRQEPAPTRASLALSPEAHFLVFSALSHAFSCPDLSCLEYFAHRDARWCHRWEGGGRAGGRVRPSPRRPSVVWRRAARLVLEGGASGGARPSIAIKGHPQARSRHHRRSARRRRRRLGCLRLRQRRAFHTPRSRLPPRTSGARRSEFGAPLPGKTRVHTGVGSAVM